MKINNVNGFKPNFGYITKGAIDAVRQHAEGYKANNKTGEGFYNTDSKYRLMSREELRKLERLAYKALMFEDSWIYCAPNGNLVVEFYKDCNPTQICRFDSKNEGNISSALDTLESAVSYAEAGEYADVDESRELSHIWKQHIGGVDYAFDRFRNAEENRILKNIYNKTYVLKKPQF